MLFKQLEYFLAIVNTGSFSEAAEQCHISQSAISQQIKSLETELGTRLFDRHNRTFSLTKAGELLYRKGTVVKNDTDNLLKEIKSSNRDKDFSLRIGYVKCYGGEEFRNASAIFSSKYPDIPLSVISGNHEELYEALKDDQVDIILNDQRRAFSDDYVNFELADSHCYIEITNTHPFSKLDIIDVNDLKNTTCILVSSYSQR